MTTIGTRYYFLLEINAGTLWHRLDHSNKIRPWTQTLPVRRFQHRASKTDAARLLVRIGTFCTCFTPEISKVSIAPSGQSDRKISWSVDPATWRDCPGHQPFCTRRETLRAVAITLSARGERLSWRRLIPKATGRYPGC